MIRIALSHVIFAAAVVAVAYTAARAEPSQQVFRDASGSTIGTAQRNGNMTTFRDSAGRTTGTATTDSGGLTTFRDAGGRTTGTTTSPFSREWQR